MSNGHVAELNYRMLFENAGCAIFVADVNTGEIIDCNNQATTLTGRSKKEMLGQSYQRLHPEDQVDIYKNKFESHARDRNFNDFEGEVLHKDGRRIPVLISGRPIYIEGREAMVGLFVDMSKSKNMEIELRRLKNYSDLILKMIPSAFYTVDTDRRITSWNATAEKITGFSEGEVVGKLCTFFALEPCSTKCGLYSDDIEKLVYFKECTIRRKDGQVLIISKNMDLLKDEDGKVVGGVESFEDITDKKKTERDLVEKERWSRAIFDQTFQFIGLMSLGGALIEANRAALEFAGLELKDVINKPFWKTPWWAHSPELQKKLKESIHKVAGGEFVRFEATHMAKDGNLHYIDFSLKPVRDESGKVVFMIPEGRDIDARKVAEDALVYKTMLLEAQAETSPDGILAVDAGGRVIFSNNRFRSLWKMPQPIIDAKDDRELLKYASAQLKYPAEFQQKVAYLYEHKDENSQDEVALVDGRFLDRYSSPLIDANGKYHGRIWFFRDVTRRKTAEKELKKYRDNLEALVEERTRELKASEERYRKLSGNLEAEVEKKTSEVVEAQAFMVRSEKLASMGKLAGIISHELRNPLGVIKNSVYFLRMKLGKDAKEPLIKKHLDILDEEIAISDRIITNTLSFSRIGEPNFEEVDLNERITQAMKKLGLPKNILIVAKLASELPAVPADKIQMEQLFSNIVRNAAESMPGGGNIIISSSFKKNVIEISFEDEGCGIPKEEIPRLFEPLFSTKIHGTGLGMAVCKEIMDKHHAKIEVESQVGKGTCIKLKFSVEKK